MLKPFFYAKCLSTLNRKTEFQYFYSNILCMIKNYGLGCQGGPLWSVFIFLRKYKSWPQCGAVLPKRNSFELRSSSWVRTHDLPFLNSSFATQLRSEMAPKFEIRRHLQILNHFFITFRLNDFAKIFFIDLVIYILLTKSLMSFDCFQRLLLWSMFYCTWMILKVKA